MGRSLRLLTALLVVGVGVPAPAQDRNPGSSTKLPDGVYAVLREGGKESDVLPLKDGEALAVDRHRYQRAADGEPPRFLVVRPAPDVELALAGAPRAVREGEQVARILVKLRPDAAAALERLTTGQVGRQVTIVLGGEVVTVHKIREAIKGGDVQITSCAAGAADYLLERLRGHRPEGK
jgi:hypothetical protein